jgi:hypothetical protein
VALDDPGPFRVNVYDKDFGFLFPLGDAAVTVSPRHLAKGTGTITVPLAHPRCEALFTPGTRMTVDYLTGADRTDDASWLRVMSGKLWTADIAAANVPAVGKVVAFGLQSNYRILEQLTGWPKPAAAIGSQTDAYYVLSGDGETVIKGILAANVGRLPYSVTMAPNLNRGATVYASVRFDRLSDVLPPLAAQAGLGITVEQVGTGLVVDVYVPTDRTTRVLSEAAGTLTSWALSSSGPSATAAIVATDGASTARHFAQFLDSATETLWDERVEAFVDARDLVNTQTAEIAQRAAQTLTDGAPQAGWSVAIAETDVVRYGRNLLVGDRVAVQITPSLALQDILSEVALTWSADNGFTVTPQVGAPNQTAQPNRMLARVLANVARGLNRLRSGL